MPVSSLLLQELTFIPLTVAGHEHKTAKSRNNNKGMSALRRISVVLLSSGDKNIKQSVMVIATLSCYTGLFINVLHFF
jgi:hypothetical protein